MAQAKTTRRWKERDAPSGIRTLVLAVRDHIKENDIDVAISGNKIHIEGDEEGLKALNADLQEALKDKDSTSV